MFPIRPAIRTPSRSPSPTPAKQQRLSNSQSQRKSPQSTSSQHSQRQQQPQAAPIRGGGWQQQAHRAGTQQSSTAGNGWRHANNNQDSAQGSGRSRSRWPIKRNPRTGSPLGLKGGSPLGQAQAEFDSAKRKVDDANRKVADAKRKFEEADRALTLAQQNLRADNALGNNSGPTHGTNISDVRSKAAAKGQASRRLTSAENELKQAQSLLAEKRSKLQALQQQSAKPRSTMWT